MKRASYQAGQIWTQGLVFLSPTTSCGVRGPASKDASTTQDDPRRAPGARAHRAHRQPRAHAEHARDRERSPPGPHHRTRRRAADTARARARGHLRARDPRHPRRCDGGVKRRSCMANAGRRSPHNIPDALCAYVVALRKGRYTGSTISGPAAPDPQPRSLRSSAAAVGRQHAQVSSAVTRYADQRGDRPDTCRTPHNALFRGTAARRQHAQVVPAVSRCAARRIEEETDRIHVPHRPRH